MHIGLQSRSGFHFARPFNCTCGMFVVQLQWNGQETVAFFVLTFPGQGDRTTGWDLQERSALIVLLGLIVNCPWCGPRTSSGSVSVSFLSSDYLRSHCFRNRPRFFRQIMREQRITKSRFSVTAPWRHQWNTERPRLPQSLCVVVSLYPPQQKPWCSHKTFRRAV